MNQLEIYFNTTNLEGAELRKSRMQADKLQREVLELLTLYHYKDFTPWEVLEHFEKQGRAPLIGSIRRALTNLTDANFLVKGEKEHQRIGRAGTPNYTWRLKG